jgi:D-3-phosphoglycerate dehydrogenase
VYEHSLNGDSLTKALSEIQPNVLVVRSTKVTAQHVDADPKLQMVVRAGAGYDTIDVLHCSKRGIYVTNCPGKNSHAVAELAMALILSIDRRIAEGVQLLKEGKWNKGMFANCVGIKGRTLGLIGFGNIA